MNSDEIRDTTETVEAMGRYVRSVYGPLWGCRDDHILGQNHAMLRRLLQRAERAEAALAVAEKTG